MSIQGKALIAVAGVTVLPTLPLRADELPKCFVESIPCDSDPVKLRQMVRDCLRDPMSCRGRWPSDYVPSTNAGGRSDAAASAVAAHPPLFRIAKRQAARPVIVASPPAEPPVTEGLLADQGATIAAVSRFLPLDGEVRALRDAVPADPGRVARQLGLRETLVAGRDMRARTPTAAEIVEALQPR